MSFRPELLSLADHHGCSPSQPCSPLSSPHSYVMGHPCYQSSWGVQAELELMDHLLPSTTVSRFLVLSLASSTPSPTLAAARSRSATSSTLPSDSPVMASLSRRCRE